MTPASMANECCKPKTSASSTGIESLRPKKIGFRLVVFMKGRLGVNKNL